MPKRRANGEGTITQRKDKNGKKTLWQAQFTDFTGERRTIYGKTQREALKKMREAQDKSDKGILVDGGKITFAEWLDQWLEVYSKPVIKEGTYSGYYNIIHIHIIPAFPKILLKDLRVDMLQRFFNEKIKTGRADKIKDRDTGELVIKEGGLSITSLIQIKGIIVSALNVAIENNLIYRNPAKSVKLPKNTQPDVSILSIDEQKKLEETALNDEVPLSVCVLLCLYTGMRLGEIAALKINDINFEAKELYVRRTVRRVKLIGEESKTKIIFSEPKTEKSKRTIPLHDFLIDLLKKHIAERNEFMNIIAESNRANNENWVDEGYLFVTRNGNVTEQREMYKHLQRLLGKAGIKRIKFHALRHTFTTRCIEAGFDVKTLADILGHTEISMTLDVYAHSLQEQKRKSIDMLSPLFKAPSRNEDNAI